MLAEQDKKIHTGKALLNLAIRLTATKQRFHKYQPAVISMHYALEITFVTDVLLFLHPLACFLLIHTKALTCNYSTIALFQNALNKVSTFFCLSSSMSPPAQAISAGTYKLDSLITFQISDNVQSLLPAFLSIVVDLSVFDLYSSFTFFILSMAQA